ncbi:alanyl-tRNA synthetase [Rhizoctonia solani AG-1 IB]|uniref:Alanyl-tRNA synthetase n=1 Tax=Thanatephorus cucumeris (strain AG1-IB / isolate 7/3/14) TaxID=1108050 RepID=A0A0B7FEL9_THACB|nr:alanyl-tRNA synthetase [Rhizoctonia solani AG-1 IB]
MIIRLSNLKFAEKWSNDPELRGSGGLHFMDHESAEPRPIDSYLSFSLLNSTERVPPVTNPKQIANESRFKPGELFRDLFSGDKPGEELSHDATIWKLYRNEAEEYDQELVKGRHASLDVLLLFAALFSAILTAFLIESKNLLQQDPADTATALLLVIAQNQINGGSGTFLTNDSPFSPTYAALWINGLWFAALALSLAAALIAMLSKEWLTAYTASRPRPAHTHALLRQARLDGLNNWWALHIIALLPTLLHLSLFLFALGLVIYLWTLDVAVAVVTCVIVALTLIFYLATTLLGAIMPFCPFVTEISRYLQQAFGSWLRKWMRFQLSDHRFSEHQSGTTLQDVRAISWLMENARDPVVVDCSYQALAGICLPNETVDPNKPNGNESKEWSKSLEHMFPALVNRFVATIRKGREIASTRGANLARFARAMVEISAFLDNNRQNAQLPVRNNNAKLRLRDGIRPRLESVALSSSSTPTTAVPCMETALTALDGVWRDEHPPFSADSYACLTAAELRLAASNSTLIYDHTWSDPSPASSALDTAINMTQPSQGSMSLPALQNTYYRSLARASVQLRYHSDGRTPINTFALVNLLDALRVASKSSGLNPQISSKGPVSSGTQPLETATSFSNSGSKDEKTPNFIIPVFTFENYLRPTALAHGPLGSIVRVLASTPLYSHSTEVISDRYAEGLKVRLAAVRALAAVAPVVLQRWFKEKVSRVGSDGVSDDPIASMDVSNWPDVDASITDTPKLEGTVASYLLLIIKAVGPHIERAGAMALVEFSLAELNRIATTSPFSAHLALRYRASQYFVPLLEFAAIDVKAADGRPLMNETTRSHILNLLTFEIAGKNSVPRVPVTPESLPLLLRVAQGLPRHTELVRSVLKYVVGRVRETKDNLGYLRVFTHSNQGYPLLLAIGRAHQANIEPVVGTILQIAHIAAGSGVILLQEGVVTGAPAIPGLLDAISLVTQHTNRVGDKQNHRHLNSLGRSLVSILQNVGHRSAQMILEHHALDELIGTLQATHNKQHPDSQPENTPGPSSENKSARSNEYLINQLMALKNQYLLGSVSSRAMTGTQEN